MSNEKATPQGDTISLRIQKARSKYDETKYSALRKQWFYELHEVNNEAIRPNDRVRVSDETIDASGVKHPATYETKPVSRITTSLEQIIVDTHTAFAVGLDPDLQASPRNEDEEHMLDLIRETERKNKIRFLNQDVVRSVLSETIVAEYWWTVLDEEFYEDKPYADGAKNRLRCEVWSPFRGDKLVPIKDAYGDLSLFYRFYTVKDENGNEIERAMEIGKITIIIFERRGSKWEPLRSYNHGFTKIPVVYMEIKEALCSRIQDKRRRIEELESNFADCINENFFPKVLIRGMMTGIQRTGKTQILEMGVNDGSDARYLTWDQSTNAAEGELSRLVDECYALTMTPRISPKDLQGLGTALSGVAFKYVFMGAHIAVRKHERFIGEYLARRYSFLKHAISRQVVSVAKGKSLRLDPILVPFTIEESTEASTESKQDKD